MATENNNKTLNVPNLRFPEFSGEWERCSLGEITTNFSRRNKEEVRYPMFSVTNNRGFVPQSEQFEDREMVGEDIKAYKIIHKNDFAYNPARINVGSIAKYNGNEPCMISSLYVCFTADKRLDNEWLIQLLKTPKMNFYYNINGEGGVRVYLFYPNFARIKTAFPSLQEQQKISSFLALLDERIATQIKIIEKLESLIKGLCQVLFSFEEYATYLLGDICSITTGKLDANAMVEGGKYPFFTCAEDVFSIDEYAFDTEALLISGNGANLGYIHYYNGKFNAYQRTYVLDKFAIDINYVRLYLESFLKYRIEQEKNTGNTPYIVLGTLSKMKIKVPNTITQQKISQSIASLKEKLSIEKQSHKKYEEQKRYLLSNLFI